RRSAPDRRRPPTPARGPPEGPVNGADRCRHGYLLPEDAEQVYLSTRIAHPTCRSQHSRENPRIPRLTTRGHAGLDPGKVSPVADESARSAPLDQYASWMLRNNLCIWQAGVVYNGLGI